MDVVTFIDHFFGTRTPRRDSLIPCRSDERLPLFGSDDKVCRTSFEVVRAFAATHKAVADTRAATGGNNCTTMGEEHASEMKERMRCQTPPE